jgi:hypothetical protein
MGHDLVMKLCPRPLAPECVSGGECNHESRETDYISFNHSENRDIWHVSMSHGHTGRVVSIQLAKAITLMKSNGVVAEIPPGGDGYTRGPGVFLLHIIRIKNMADRNPGLTFLSDQYWSFNPDPNDSDSDNYVDCIDVDEIPIKIDSVTYFRHPVKGNMKIDNFASASEVFTLMTIKGDPRASYWLDLAKKMSDAPIV